MNLGHDGGAFTNAGGYTLDGSAPHISNRENARAAGL